MNVQAAHVLTHISAYRHHSSQSNQEQIQDVPLVVLQARAACKLARVWVLQSMPSAHTAAAAVQHHLVAEASLVTDSKPESGPEQAVDV